MLNHIIAKTVRKHFARQRRDGHTSGFPLQDITKVFEVGVATTNGGMAQFECWDVGAAEDLVVGVHTATDAMGARVFDLRRWLAGAVWSVAFGEEVPLSRGSSREGHRSLRSSAYANLAWPAWWITDFVTSATETVGGSC